jgi:hypothetical protein
MRPDTKSRSGDEDGRRLILLDPHRDWGWQIVNYEPYRQMRDDDARRAYFREKKREYRRKGKPDNVLDSPTLSNDVHTGPPESTQAEAEEEADRSGTSYPHPIRSVNGKPKLSPEEGIYRQYPKKVEPGEAKKAIAKAIERVRKGEGSNGPIPDKHEASVFLFRRVQAYARSPAGSKTNREFIPYPSKWFNRSRYLEDEVEWQHIGGRNDRSTAQSKQDATVAAVKEGIARLRAVDHGGAGEDSHPDGGGDQFGATLFDDRRTTGR